MLFYNLLLLLLLILHTFNINKIKKRIILHTLMLHTINTTE